MNDKVFAARLGMGTHAAQEAIENAKKASTADEKIVHLTEAIEILLGHIDHIESQKSLDEMNQRLHNI